MTNSRKGFVVQAPALQKALATAIATQLEASGDATPVSVCYPAGGLTAEHIWISGKFDAEMPRCVSGGRQRDDEGYVEVRISVVWSTSDGVVAEDRAVALSKFVENAVSVDPTLGGAVQEAHVAGVSGNEAMPDEHSRQYGLVLRIAYQTTAVLA
jgi:hypothetical protein